MKAVIQERIRLLRAAITNSPDGILAGKINPSNEAARTGIHQWDQFLAEADGGRFAIIDLWAADELKRNQYFLHAIPSGETDWMVVGQLAYEPLALSRTNDTIVLLQQDETPKPIGTLEFFLAECVFGNAYAKMSPAPEQDEWWLLLKAQGYAG